MRDGIAFSVILHGAVIGYAALALSPPSEAPESEPPIPVEIVMLEDPEQSRAPLLELPDEARPPEPEAEPEAPVDLAEVAPPEELEEEVVEQETPPEPEEPDLTEPVPEEEPLSLETPQLAETDLAPEIVQEPLQPEQVDQEADPEHAEAPHQPEPEVAEPATAEPPPHLSAIDNEPPPADVEDAPLEVVQPLVEQAVLPRKLVPVPRVKPLPVAPVRTAEAAPRVTPAAEPVAQAVEAPTTPEPSEVAMVGSAEGVPSDQLIDELRKIVLLLQEQIGRCWQRRAGTHPVLQLDVSLNRNGTVREIDMSNWQELSNDDRLRRTANDAFDAIRQCSPFSLPADKYALWRELRFRLHPRS